jgi:hypothetical protein
MGQLSRPGNERRFGLTSGICGLVSSPFLPAYTVVESDR